MLILYNHDLVHSNQMKNILWAIEVNMLFALAVNFYMETFILSYCLISVGRILHSAVFSL